MAFLALLVLSPLFLVIFILIKITSRGPAVHHSKRIGQFNNFFMMPKFRTMRIDTPQVATHLLSDSGQYITAIGAILRKTSLDELPQLVSIIKGDMNFVGPRPALYNQDDLREMRSSVGVDKLKPGVTGWAQINGRDNIGLDLKVKLDREYLEKKSATLDLKIVFLTFYKIIKKEDIKH